MANKNKRTKARREKEVKESKRKKVEEKPIHKRPWIWIALAAIVVAIVVPSAIQYSRQLEEDRKTAAADAQAKNEAELLAWDSVLAPLEEMGVSESAITDRSVEVLSATDNGTYDYAQVMITTDVRTLVATSVLESAEGAWMCAQIANEDGTHVYWTYSIDPSTTQLYDYITDEALPTGPAIESPDTATGPAAEADTPTGPATESDTSASTGAAASTDTETEGEGDTSSPGAAGGPDTGSDGEGAGD